MLPPERPQTSPGQQQAGVAGERAPQMPKLVRFCFRVEQLLFHILLRESEAGNHECVACALVTTYPEPRALQTTRERKAKMFVPRGSPSPEGKRNTAGAGGTDRLQRCARGHRPGGRRDASSPGGQRGSRARHPAKPHFRPNAGPAGNRCLQDNLGRRTLHRSARHTIYCFQGENPEASTSKTRGLAPQTTEKLLKISRQIFNVRRRTPC